MNGLYDEALSLVRGLGEISNLIALSAVDQGVAQEWIRSDEKVRRRKFSPIEVRRRLERIDPGLMLANKEWIVLSRDMPTRALVCSPATMAKAKS